MSTNCNLSQQVMFSLVLVLALYNLSYVQKVYLLLLTQLCTKEVYFCKTATIIKTTLITERIYHKTKKYIEILKNINLTLDKSIFFISLK